MKKNYVQPATTVVSVAAHGHILDGSNSRISKTSSNANIGYGGGGTGSARVKDATDTYDVWDDDWQGQ